MHQVAAISAHCPQVLHLDSTHSRRMASRSGVVSRAISALASIRQAIRADEADKLIGGAGDEGALLWNSAVARRAASSIRGTSNAKATCKPHLHNFWCINGVQFGRRQASFEVISWQASSRTIAEAAESAASGLSPAFSVSVSAARIKHPAKWSRFSGVSIPRNSKSAACRMAPSQTAVEGEISVSVMGAEYGAGRCQIESLKGAADTAHNPDAARGLVNLPAVGA